MTIPLGARDAGRMKRRKYSQVNLLAKPFLFRGGRVSPSMLSRSSALVFIETAPPVSYQISLTTLARVVRSRKIAKVKALAWAI